MKTINLLLIGLTVLMSSCDKNFGEININKNAPQEVSPNLILPGVLRSIFDHEVRQSFTYGNTAVNMVAKSFDDQPGRYNWTTNGSWGHTYSNLRNIEAMLTFAQKEKKPEYEGISLILKSYLIALNTQLHGDVPYSQSVNGKKEGNFTPVYDAQEDIFKQIVADLEKANELLSSEANIIGDIVYNGKSNLWRKFANSFHLRILTRLSEKWNVGPMINKIVSNSITYPIFESVDEEFKLTFLSSAPNQYPMFTYRLGDITDQRLGKPFADTLLKYEDKRIALYAQPTANSIINNNPIYVGVPNGLFNAATNNYNGGEANQSHISPRYHEFPDATHTIMSLAELQFILAEAALKGWINGEASTFYENGIVASFKNLGIEVNSEYLANTHVKLSNEFNTAFRQIMTQKWLASFYYGWESYFEYRRTGHPFIIPGPDNVNSNKVPMRFRYPTQEQDLNIDNYKAVIQSQGSDDINTLMWLLKLNH